MSIVSVPFLLLACIYIFLSFFTNKVAKLILISIFNILFIYFNGGIVQILVALIYTLITILALKINNKVSTIIYTLISISLIVVNKLVLSNTFISLLAFSYISLKGISLVIDKYKNNIKKENILSVFSYLYYFLAILQGPIINYNDFIKAIDKGNDFNYSARRNGFIQALFGYMEKLVISSSLLPIVLQAINNANQYNILVRILFLLVYVYVLYIDWDGYSNIVIGISKASGVNIKENFMAPLLSKNASDFWKRWHISLGSFLTKYIYIPLGGSRVDLLRNIVNCLIVFIICGLWHGITPLYIVWGLINGLAVSLVHIIKESNKGIQVFVGYISVVITILSLSLFAFSNLSEFMTYLSIAKSGNGSLLITNNQLIVYIVLTLFIFLFDIIRYHRDGFKWLGRRNIIIRWLIYIILIVLIVVAGSYGSGYDAANFIYQIF